MRYSRGQIAYKTAFFSLMVLGLAFGASQNLLTTEGRAARLAGADESILLTSNTLVVR